MRTADNEPTENDVALSEADMLVEECEGCGGLTAPEDLDGGYCDGCIAEDEADFGDDAPDRLGDGDEGHRGERIA